MKKYLFGLGAMVVGAGLIFVLMHGEVSADHISMGGVKMHCEILQSGHLPLSYCKITRPGLQKDVTCITNKFGTSGVSCFKN